MPEVQAVDLLVHVAQHVSHRSLGGPLGAAAQVEVRQEIRWRDVPTVGEGMVSMRHEEQLIAGQLDCKQLRVGRALDKGAVEGADEHPAVQVRRRVDGDVELDARMSPGELGQVRREVVGRACWAGAQMQGARLQVLHRERRVPNDLDRPQRGAACLRQ